MWKNVNGGFTSGTVYEALTPQAPSAEEKNTYFIAASLFVIKTFK